VGDLYLLRQSSPKGAVSEYNCTNPTAVRQIVSGPSSFPEDIPFIMNTGWEVECNGFTWKRQVCGSTNDTLQMGLCVNSDAAQCANDCTVDPSSWVAPCAVPNALTTETAVGDSVLAHPRVVGRLVPEDESALITGASLGGMFLFLLALVFGKRIFCPNKRDHEKEEIKVNRTLQVDFQADVDGTMANPMHPGNDMKRNPSGMQRGQSGMGRNPSGMQRGQSGMGRNPSGMQRGQSGMGRNPSGMQRGKSGMTRGMPGGDKKAGVIFEDEVFEDDGAVTQATGVVPGEEADFGSYVEMTENTASKKTRSASILMDSSGPQSRAARGAAAGGLHPRASKMTGTVPFGENERSDTGDERGATTNPMLAGGVGGRSPGKNASGDKASAMKAMGAAKTARFAASRPSKIANEQEEEGMGMSRGQSQFHRGAAAAAVDDDDSVDSDDDPEATTNPMLAASNKKGGLKFTGANVSSPSMGSRFASKMAVEDDEEADSDDEPLVRFASKAAVEDEEETDSDDEEVDTFEAVNDLGVEAQKVRQSNMQESSYMEAMRTAVSKTVADKSDTAAVAKEREFKFAVARTMLSLAPPSTLMGVRKAVGGDRVDPGEASALLEATRSSAGVDQQTAGLAMTEVAVPVLSAMVDTAVQKRREAAEAGPGWELAKADEAAVAMADVVRALASCESLYSVVAGDAKVPAPAYSGSANPIEVEALLDEYVTGTADSRAGGYRDVETVDDRERNNEAVKAFFSSAISSGKRRPSFFKSAPQAVEKPFGKYVGGAAETAWGTAYYDEEEGEFDEAAEASFDATPTKTWGAAGSKSASALGASDASGAAPVKKKWAVPVPDAKQAAALSKVSMPGLNPRRRGTLYGPFLCGPTVDTRRSPAAALEATKAAFNK
jgi:hypothetical protein